MQLAEINLARLTHAVGHPAVAGFVDNLDRVNALAERMPGFVWRHEGGTETRVDRDPLVIGTLSVWEDVRSLEGFVWGTLHARLHAERAAWFDAMERLSFAMWWVEDGHRPTVAEALSRLKHRDAEGDSDHAFDWAHPPQATRWRTAEGTPA